MQTGRRFISLPPGPQSFDAFAASPPRRANAAAEVVPLLLARRRSSAQRTNLRSVSGGMPRSAAICAIGRSDSRTSRTPRRISSSAYFRGRGIGGASPLQRTHRPPFEVSVKPGLAQLPLGEAQSRRIASVLAPLLALACRGFCSSSSKKPCARLSASRTAKCLCPMSPRESWWLPRVACRGRRSTSDSGVPSGSRCTGKRRGDVRARR
jgi:hypothetical protein